MIINVQSMPHKFKCKKLLANYLQYERNLPLLSVDSDYYYFVDNDLLQEILESLPWWLKLLKNF
jgi:hypothetical protein